MTRNGKIARLPRAVRDEVNRRMDDGEPGPGLLAWLNGLEEVRLVLKAQFAGRAINKQNLSEWRLGGFKEWRQGQESLGMAREFMEQMEEIRESTQGEFLSDAVADLAALSLARAVRGAGQLNDVREQSRAVVPLVREVVRLRASDRAYERAQRRKEVAERRLVISNRKTVTRGQELGRQETRRDDGPEVRNGEPVRAGQTESRSIRVRGVDPSDLKAPGAAGAGAVIAFESTKPETLNSPAGKRCQSDCTRLVTPGVRAG